MNYAFFDFNLYYHPEEVSKYELFIGPLGEYYKVKTRYESDYNYTHYCWAMGYIEKHNLTEVYHSPKVEKVCKTPLEFLVNYLGFIRYTHIISNGSRVYMSIPNEEFFGYIPSRSQIDAVYHLMDYNHDVADEEQLRKLEKSDYDYDKKVDMVFEKMKRR